MNNDRLIENAENVLTLTENETEDVMKLAAVGMGPRDIAAVMEFDQRRANIFIALASVPDSSVAKAIAEGYANGIAAPQIKLQEAASSGNIEAIRELTKAQDRNRYNELLSNMDDDEFTI